MAKRKKSDKKNVASIRKLLQQGLDELFSSEQYRDFLTMMSRFPNYSYANTVLVLRQCPHAVETHTFRGWIKLGRIPNQSGIKIRAPKSKRDDKDKDASVDDPDDMDFRTMTVFDISQTVQLDGREEPQQRREPVKVVTNPFRAQELVVDVDGYMEIMAVLRQISPYAIRVEQLPEKDKRKGFANFSRRIIVVRQGMSQLHTIKTAIHEIAHAMLHTAKSDVKRREIEAESIAYIVCHRLGLDTASYSFHYIAGYSVGRDKKEMRQILDTIQKTACYLIDYIEGELEARRLRYSDEDYVMLVNNSTAMRLHGEGVPVYLLYPGEGELFVTKKEQILQHTGPYAVEHDIWQDRERIAA